MKKEPPGTEQVSVLIPTVNRYPYLKKLLSQLKQLKTSPAEVIVIDQTRKPERDTQLYKDFSGLPLKVIYQDIPGQCSSRNQGIRQCKGEYILLIDDDDEVPESLIDDHLQNLRQHGAQVSAGVCQEAGAGPLPGHFTWKRASDVFPANNSLIEKKILKTSGLFDLAYNAGSRADGDLGMRLYLKGSLMVLNPVISVIHHHAPSGGLRLHKARTVTYASSRQYILHRHLPAVTEIYLGMRYFSPRQVREMLWQRALGTLQIKGGSVRKMVKIAVSGCFLIHTLWIIRKRIIQAQQMLKKFPEIPAIG